VYSLSFLGPLFAHPGQLFFHHQGDFHFPFHKFFLMLEAFFVSFFLVTSCGVVALPPWSNDRATVSPSIPSSSPILHFCAAVPFIFSCFCVEPLSLEAFFSPISPENDGVFCCPYHSLPFPPNCPNLPSFFHSVASHFLVSHRNSDSSFRFPFGRCDD